MGWEHASLKLAFLVCFWQKTKQYPSITNAAKFHNKTKRLQKFQNQNRSERLRQIWFWRFFYIQEWRMKVRYLICLNLNLRQSLMMMQDRHHGKDPVKERSPFTNLLVRNNFWILYETSCLYSFQWNRWNFTWAMPTLAEVNSWKRKCKSRHGLTWTFF